ncbi:hypothetical protein GCM10007094_21510 [Pseudovibrio japonicus]|uniref:Uncharacterized protein n=1 Tax=Pseudovibrio japonicus TaxID=366534 RepID=A0ABQ3EBB6_9HYPH|nr:hypothetical protein GCM10007094_21510 [Pseudovibrio japonicus]
MIAPVQACRGFCPGCRLFEGLGSDRLAVACSYLSTKRGRDRYTADDALFDNHIVGTANHDEVFNIVPADQQ